MPKFGHIDIPLQRVHLELTNVCDFHCTFCPKPEMKRPLGYMDPALAMRLMDELKEGGVCDKVTFHVMGEPTLHPKFFDILSHASKIGMKVGLTTNGSGLGGKVGQRLLEHELHQVDVSFQTPDARSYHLRGARALKFEDYRDGVMSFLGAYHKRYPQAMFKFRFLNTRFKCKPMEKRVGPVRVMSSTQELRTVFSHWANMVYDAIGTEEGVRRKALEIIGRLSAYRWNVVEVAPNVYFETYVLSDWGHAFDDTPVREAWAGYCFGMRDHFAVLFNGDVTLCCVDYDGKTVIGNVADKSLREVLSTEEVGRIVEGFKRYKVVHPYCKRCLGSGSLLSWIFKPIVSVAALKTLKPLLYKKIRLYK